MTCVNESLKLLRAEIVHCVLLIAIAHGLWPDLNFWQLWCIWPPKSQIRLCWCQCISVGRREEAASQEWSKGGDCSGLGACEHKYHAEVLWAPWDGCISAYLGSQWSKGNALLSEPKSNHKHHGYESASEPMGLVSAVVCVVCSLHLCQYIEADQNIM